MSGVGAWARPRLDGLAARVGALLSLALLPVGLLAIYQTREVQDEGGRRAELTLLALTDRSAAGVQQAIERALGTADSLGRVADLIDDPATCAGTLGRYAGEGRPYSFAGVLPGEGPVVCSTAGAPYEIADRPAWEALLAHPRPLVLTGGAGPGTEPASGGGVIEVLVPIDPAAGRAGFLGLSLPREGIAPLPPGSEDARPLGLVTFNAAGDVLTAEAGTGADLEDLLPVGRPLSGQAGGGPRTFAAADGTGEERLYTVVPLVPDVAYALAVWTPAQGARAAGVLGGAPLLVPIAMWVVSLAVAFWAIHLLVIRRVGDLAGRMRRFGRDRTLPEPPPPGDAPRELREIEVAFRQTAEEIVQDEARMENAFRERGVLLREVHHRVKNNLQLISSIISMQVRRTADAPTRAILRRLQDRVLTLAAIYRSLYTSDDMAEVNVAPVLRVIVEQELRDAPGVGADLAIDDLVLDPDKVIPLAFLAAEAVANAVAHAEGDGQRRVALALRREGDGAVLEVANRVAPPAQGEPEPADDAEWRLSTRGLGQHLMRAFAAQLGGSVEVSRRGGVYRVAVTFALADAEARVAA